MAGGQGHDGRLQEAGPNQESAAVIPVRHNGRREETFLERRQGFLRV